MGSCSSSGLGGHSVAAALEQPVLRFSRPPPTLTSDFHGTVPVLGGEGQGRPGVAGGAAARGSGRYHVSRGEAKRGGSSRGVPFDGGRPGLAGLTPGDFYR